MTSEEIVEFDLNLDGTFLDIKENYKFIDHPDNPNANYRCIKLLHGKFAGLVYRYGRFKLAGRDNPNNSRTIQYEYDVIKIPENIKGVEYSDKEEKEFSTLLANILIDMMKKWTENHKSELIYVKDEDVEARINDTEKTVARRTIYPAGNPFSKE
jgi:hypothetical protein